MRVEFPYGSGQVVLEIPDDKLSGVYVPRERPGVADLESEVLGALSRPIESRRLSDLARGCGSAAIVVDDVSRPVPNSKLLPPVVMELRKADLSPRNVTVIVATGLHRKLTDGELSAIRGDLPVRIINHDANDETQLVSVGVTSLGQDIKINRTYVESELKVLITDVEYHQFCGYGGGAKSIYPGLADAESIRHNHSMMEVEGAGPGRWKGNPVRQEVEEVGRMAGADFLISVVMNSEKQVVNVDTGDVVEAFLNGTRLVDDMYKVRVPETVDLVIASAGGFPKDIDLYQSQKAVTGARRIVDRGGAIAAIAECREGHGSELFHRWMTEAAGIDDIVERYRRKFVMGGHKAYQFAREILWARVHLMSSLRPESVRSYFLTPLNGPGDFEQLIRRAKRIAALPQATLTLAESSGTNS